MEKPKDKLKYIKEAELIEREIKSGKFGMPGQSFMATRELAKIRKVSLVTAQKILVELRRKNLVELCGKKYYLTHGRLPNKSSLKKKKTSEHKLIGLHITNLESQFFASLARAVEVCAKAEGYRVLISSSSYKYEEEKEILDMFRNLGVWGVLSCPGTSENIKAIYESYPLPCVFLGRKPDGITAEGVLANNYPAAKSIASHFISKGFKNFGYLGLEELPLGDDLRLTGFIDGLLRDGFVLEEKNILRVKGDNIKGSFAKVEGFLRNLQKPAGIFCFHDLLAVSLLKICGKMKINVPETIAIAGFDDLPIASHTVPPLTSVSYRVDEMAQMAFRLLLNQITSGKENNTNYYVEPSLMIRGSSSTVNILSKNAIEMRDILS